MLVKMIEYKQALQTSYIFLGEKKKQQKKKTGKFNIEKFSIKQQQKTKMTLTLKEQYTRAQFFLSW